MRDVKRNILHLKDRKTNVVCVCVCTCVRAPYLTSSMGSKDAFAFSTAMTHAALMKFTPSCTSPMPGMVENETEEGEKGVRRRRRRDE